MILINTIHLIHVKFFRRLEIKGRRTIMNCVEYVSVGIEDFTSKQEGKTQRAKPLAVTEREGESQMKPFAVPGGRARRGDQVACRVAEVLDFELARGAMPT